MDVGVQVALEGEEGADARGVRDGPVVRSEQRVGFGRVPVDGLGEVFGPAMRVADLGAAEGEQVVEGVGCVFGRAEGAFGFDVDEHL